MFVSIIRPQKKKKKINISSVLVCTVCTSFVLQTESGWHQQLSREQTYIVAPGENRAPLGGDASTRGTVNT